MKLKTLYQALGFLFIMSLFAFFISRLIPGYPASLYLESKQLAQSPENIALINEEFGLDRSLMVQYFQWISHFIQGDWGTSFYSSQPIRQEIFNRLPASLMVGLGGVLLAMLGSFYLGFLASLPGYGFWDKVSRALSLISQAIPSFILIIIFIQITSVRLRWFKFYTEESPLAIVFAVIVVAFYQIGPLSRIVCRHFEATQKESYLKALLLRGLPLKQALGKYAWQDALYGLLASSLAQMSWVIGGTAIVEYSFGIAGISNYLVTSMQRRDYLVIQAYIMVVGIWMLIIRLIFRWLMNRLRKETSYVA
ncbi:ABC transporter permease [Aerococcus sp. CDC-944-U94]|uniref:ABC transporter permease n=1 Tax=Aerococcus urinae (strain CCUG 59500 / ACS-120-V-Col10a) TaxID=2976812 RepID=UPI00227B3B91|nr:ABC transporter permease [Aerococcus sp. Group 1]MCY3055275.1 ABC transporter permease [Aerococcus sp. Group 1]MCY3057005.1 ABC transporter permease [Aerococcus sp. Group 1]